MENAIARLSIVFTAVIAFCFVLFDVSVWPFDPAYYGEVTLQLYYSLLYETDKFWNLFVGAFAVKAPGIAWFGMLFVPLSNITGSIESALLVFVVCSGLLAGWLIYKTLRAIQDRQNIAAVGGLLYFLTAPLFIGLLYNYFTEQLQLLAVCIVLWAVCVKQRKHLMIAFGIIGLAVGMLAKASTPLYILAPSVIGLCTLFGEQTRERSSWSKNLGVWTLAFVFSAGVFAWYHHNWEALRTFIASTSSGSIAELYGSSGSFSEKFSKWQSWARGAFFVGILPFKIWLVLLALSLLSRVTIVKTPLSRFDFIAFLSAIQILIVLSIFSLQINEETRYLLPTLPYIAILTAYMIAHLNKFLRSVAIVGLLFQFAIVHAASFGAEWARIYIHTPWLRSLERNPYSKNLLQEVTNQSCNKAVANHYTIIGLELSSFNANTAAFYSEKQKLKQGYRCFYTSLGYAETDPQKAFNRIKELKAEAVVFLHSYKGSGANDPFNAVSNAVKGKLSNDSNYELQSIPAFPDLEYYDRHE